MADTFTPEQITQILEEFFKVVGTRKYIGERYVPIFGRKGEESIQWDNSAPYEPLTIVLYQGNSYTSRQYVPIGIDITNQEFWVITGNYNAQVEAYHRETITAREIADNAITTANNAQNDINTLLPKADFSAENTVKKYIDVLDARKVKATDTDFVIESTTMTLTSFSDIDADYVSYEGYVASSNGSFTQNAIFNSWLFRCPENNYPIRSNAYRMFIVNGAPDVVAGTVPIVDTLVYNNTTEMIDVTIANRGDMVLLCKNTTNALKLVTKSASPLSLPRLILSESQETFNRYAVKSSAPCAFGNSLLNVQSLTGLINVNTGGISTEQTTYTTYYFRVSVESLVVNCTNGFRAALCYSAPSETSTYNLIQLLYTYSSGRIDTFTATYGQWVCVSVPNSQGAIELSTNLLVPFTMPLLEIDYMQADSFYKYEEIGAARYLYIYYRSGDNLVRYELHNVPSASINSDTWQLGQVCGYNMISDAPSNEVVLVSGGEFELAFKEHGAADFCGGNNHGDETTDTFVLHIDGKQISDLTTLDVVYHKFNRIDAFEIATINRCDTPSEHIITHQKIWTFENGKVKVNQTLRFIETLEVDGILVCMLAANRSSFTHGIRRDGTAVENMSTPDYTQVRTNTNDMFYLMYGSDATAKVSAKTDNPNGTSALWINNTSTLNKLYYTYFSDSNATYPKTVNAGTMMQIESEYDIAYS